MLFRSARVRVRAIPFPRRTRLLAPFAATAAAAAVLVGVFAPSTVSVGRTTGPETVANLTPEIASSDLERLAGAIADIQSHANSGQPVPAPLLRAVSEGTARVANIIEQSPERVSKETVASYIQTAQTGQTVLSSLTVDPNAQGALAAAQRAARDGVVEIGRAHV